MAGSSVLRSPVAAMLRPASELAGPPGLPVHRDLADLLPWPRLRPGTIIGVTSRAPAGLTSVVLALLTEASQAGAWCALVGAREVSPHAAAHVGVALSRLALVPDPGDRDDQVTGALLEGLDVVAVRTGRPVSRRTAARLAGKARNRGGVLVPFGPAATDWPDADARLDVIGARWYGLDTGRGLLRHCRLTVAATVHGRRREATVWPYGRPAAAERTAPVISLFNRRDVKGGDPGAGHGRTVSRLG
ncbi:hypothetical protein LX16_0784 [Stackebrandtia albiflava]|uniref:Protein RecA n=1 Tax=Stackebrandtia albiflava TaxID=406432 RepID=A0A562VB35_9ACTN|nr:hypothetical protein [Stackebrandtia albiflava]TWJ15086.1 hypothetical protein LX16_0784 [Stackebrandtia albiflava]